MTDETIPIVVLTSDDIGDALAREAARRLRLGDGDYQNTTTITMNKGELEARVELRRGKA